MYLCYASRRKTKKKEILNMKLTRTEFRKFSYELKTKAEKCSFENLSVRRYGEVFIDIAHHSLRVNQHAYIYRKM